MVTRSLIGVACMCMLPACDVLGPGDGDGPRLLAEFGPADIEYAPPDPGDSIVDVAIFLGVAAPELKGDWRSRATTGVRDAVDFVNEQVFAQCALHVRLERAGVVGLPQRLLSIQGNERGSWGGHPPPGVDDSLRFVYDERERLTAETRELFTFGKRHSARSTIAAFTVDHITYYIGEDPTPARGLSFPPVVYHHSDDYPARNSVLIGELPRSANGVPEDIPGDVLAHELAHMLLNSPLHDGAAENLMGSGGLKLDAGQCAQMKDNNELLFGDSAVVDPGRPAEP
ncbi:MAG: hypothetical protein ACRELV_00065 [Longimicrobiales bacterium]